MTSVTTAYCLPLQQGESQVKANPRQDEFKRQDTQPMTGRAPHQGEPTDRINQHDTTNNNDRTIPET